MNHLRVQTANTGKLTFHSSFWDKFLSYLYFSFPRLMRLVKYSGAQMVQKWLFSNVAYTNTRAKKCRLHNCFNHSFPTFYLLMEIKFSQKKIITDRFFHKEEAAEMCLKSVNFLY